jgi:hypothetical protein
VAGVVEVRPSPRCGAVAAAGSKSKTTGLTTNTEEYVPINDPITSAKANP